MKIFLTLLLSLSFLFAKIEVIAKIPEASGICYSTKSNTLFIVNDEGTIYEITKKGKVLRSEKIGDYDFEGITIDDKKSLLLIAIEGKDSILVLKQKNFKIKKILPIKRKYKKIKLLKKSGDGIEAIALYKNKIYVANQSNKKYPKEDSSIIAILDYKLNKKKLKIKDIIDPKYTDISGMTFYKNRLFMISDKNNLIIEYDIQNKKVLGKRKLSKKFAQEGITFDNKGILYIADDKGKVLKYKD